MEHPGGRAAGRFSVEKGVIKLHSARRPEAVISGRLKLRRQPQPPLPG